MYKGMCGTFSTAPPQEAKESNEVGYQPSVLQTGQPKHPQSLFIGQAFQPCYQLCCCHLDIFKYSISFLYYGAQNYMQCSKQGHINAKYSGTVATFD